MKRKEITLIIILSITFLILFYPWFEIFVLLIALLSLWSYYHYWMHKEKYGPYLYYGRDPTTDIIVNWVGVDEYFKLEKEKAWIQICTNSKFIDKSQIQDCRVFSGIQNQVYRYDK